eukprot:1158457-Pelagomonas_calceolata.AAC.7
MRKQVAQASTGRRGTKSVLVLLEAASSAEGRHEGNKESKEDASWAQFPEQQRTGSRAHGFSTIPTAYSKLQGTSQLREVLASGRERGNGYMQQLEWNHSMTPEGAFNTLAEARLI